MPVKNRLEITAIVCFAFLAIGILVKDACLGHVAHTDEVFFKAAGLHWADGDGWKAPEERNFSGWQPPLQEVFASYPPLYPFLFGVSVKCFGFNQTVSNVYDTVIHILLASVMVFFIRRALPNHNWLAWGFGCLWMLVEYPARPDRLAMIFGYLALGLVLGGITGRGKRRDWQAAICLGCCAGTSIPCAIALTPLVVGACVGRAAGLAQLVKVVIKIGLVSMVTLLAIVAPVLWYDSRALDQNIMATLKSSSASSAAMGIKEGFFHVLRYHTQSLACILILIGAVSLIGIYLLLRETTEQRRHWLIWLLAPAAPCIFFAFNSTFQGFYHWFLIPWFAAALFAAHSNVGWRAVIITLLVAFTLPVMFAQRQNVGEILTGSEQRVSTFENQITSVIPPGATVLTNSYWWLLARRNQVLDSMTSPSLKAAEVEYIILTGQGSGAVGRPQPLPAFASTDLYEKVVDHLSISRPTLFGFPIFRSTVGAGPVVYRRKPDFAKFEQSNNAQ